MSQGGGNGGGAILFSSQRVGVAAPTVDVPNIPGGFTLLEATIRARSTIAATTDIVYVAFNGDAADVNYDRELLNAGNAAVAAIPVQGAAASRFIGSAAGGTALANAFGQIKLTIVRYADPLHLKDAVANASLRAARAAAGLSTVQSAIAWANNAAINQLTFSLNGGPNFDVGTTVDVRLFP